MVTREGHQDALTFEVELAGGVDAAGLAPAFAEAIREVMRS